MSEKETYITLQKRINPIAYKKVTTLGNTVGIIIPFEWVEYLKLKRGRYMRLSLSENKIILEPTAETSEQAFQV